MALNVSWKSHPTREQLYGEMPKVSKKVEERRMRLSGHFIRYNEAMLIDWYFGNQQKEELEEVEGGVNYVDNLLQDA